MAYTFFNIKSQIGKVGLCDVAFSNFKNKILDKAQAKIAEHTDINFTYKEIKRGKSVEVLIFNIYTNKPKVVETQSADMVIEYEDVTEEEEVEELTLFNPLHQAYFDRLNGWWGIGKEEFLKRIGDKTELDIEKAIEFTKGRIKAGKAVNPAGIFLDALSKGYKTPQQIKTEKNLEKERLDKEKQEKIKPLLAEYEDLSSAFSSAINNAIRDITSEDPAITEGAMERIKAMHAKMGNKKIIFQSIEDFRRDPFLREMVKSDIMHSFPEKFARINEQFKDKMQHIVAKIKAIDPNHPNI